MTPSGRDPDFTDLYNTPIPAEKQGAFDQWAAQQQQASRTPENPNGKDPRGDRFNYDVNGFFLSNSTFGARHHGTDVFKKPNHPTFSDQSQWHGIDGYTGGRWGGDDETGANFQPSQTNLEFHPDNDLPEYMASDAEKPEPGHKRAELLPAVPVPVPTGHGGNYTMQDLGGAPPAPPPYRVKPPQVMTPATAPAEFMRTRKIYGQ